MSLGLVGRKVGMTRIFAEDGSLHVISAGLHLSGTDPFVLFEKLAVQAVRGLDAGHASYLGYEMAKAVTALTLGKDYRQDEALDWGFLSVPEQTHRHRPTPLAREARDAGSENRETGASNA